MNDVLTKPQELPVWDKRGPAKARTLIGKFRLEDPSGPLHSTNVRDEGDRAKVEKYANAGYKLRWVRVGNGRRTSAEVYYNPQLRWSQLP
jgi:hypothetical protein